MCSHLKAQLDEAQSDNEFPTRGLSSSKLHKVVKDVNGLHYAASWPICVIN